VRVSPGILETKVIVAPNSPKLRANPNIAAAMRPGEMIGMVIVKKTRKGDAPSVAAASSGLRQLLEMKVV